MVIHAENIPALHDQVAFGSIHGHAYDVWLENRILAEMTVCDPSIRQNPRINLQQNRGFTRGSYLRTNEMIEIYSTQAIGGLTKLNIKVVSDHLKLCTSCTIITAYYSSKFFNELCAQYNKPEAKKLDSFTLVVSFQSKLLTQSGKEELENIKKNLEKISKTVVIKINEKYPIMHSKIYRFRTDDQKTSTYLIGSANASNAAFNVNEEILFEVGSSKNISRYCEALIKESTELAAFTKDNTHKSNNLTSFFQQGFLFVKYPYALSLSYQPESLKKILKQDSPVVGFEPGELFGGFQLEKYYKVGRSVRGEQLKKYSIQTNLGLWIPAFYLEHVINSINGKQETKEGYYSNLLKTMEHGEPGNIFEETVKNVINYLNENNDTNRLDQFQKWANSEQKKHFNTWFSRVKDKIEKISNKQGNSDKLTQQYYLGGDVYYLSPMPSIWSDESESQEFIDYFFDSVEMFGGVNGRASSWVAESIKDMITDMPEDDFVKKFESFLENKGWDARYWKEPDTE